MKSTLVLLTLLSLTLAACSPRGSQRSEPSKAQGGVDVGNLQSTDVPATSAWMSYPSNWNSSKTGTELKLQNSSGSSVRAERAQIPDLASPTAISLQRYLQSKHPTRQYKIINLNGLEGVRADLLNNADRRQSDLYLVSELRDFIHIESDLLQTSGGIAQGEAILLTVRIRYAGVPYPSHAPKTVTIGQIEQQDTETSVYSLQDDCFSYSSDCQTRQGVGIGFYEKELNIGLAGYDTGRVVELGTQLQVPFEAIRVEGEFLVAPASTTPLSDIYTMFTPRNPQKDQSRLELKEGSVYLIRTISWPDEDMITKVRVDKLTAHSATLTYQKLVQVTTTTLQKQVDQLNQYTLEFEKPRERGEVTLFSRSHWDSSPYASFNFEYSTSGNMHITHNSWDLMFENGDDGKPTLSSSYSGSGLGQVIDMGVMDLNAVKLSHFPDPNGFSRDTDGAQARLGHTYLVYTYDYSSDQNSAVFGAVQVLSLDPQGKWVQLRFRRLQVRQADHFQKWISLTTPQGVQTVTLQKTADSRTSVFLPFITKRADQGSHYYEDISFSDYGPQDSYLRVDSRPFGADRGFFKLGAGRALESVTLAEIEALRGQFSHYAPLEAGTLYAVLLENYYNKTVMVMRVDRLQPGSTQLSMRYLARAKTRYSDDGD